MFKPIALWIALLLDGPVTIDHAGLVQTCQHPFAYVDEQQTAKMLYQPHEGRAQDLHPLP